jgi:hypothetical protein
MWECVEMRKCENKAPVGKCENIVVICRRFQLEYKWDYFRYFKIVIKT